MVEVIHVHNGNHEIDLFISFIANEVSLNIKIQSMEYFPRWTIPLNTLLIWFHWFLRHGSGALFMKDISVRFSMNTF